MNSARRIDPQTPSRRAARLLRGWGWVASALSVAACGSADANFSAAGSEAAGSGAARAGASSTSAGASNPSAAGAGAGNAAGGSNAGTSGSSSTAAAGGAAQAGAGGSAVCSNADSCTACLCDHCATEVATCESTPGCQAIADCVATSRCEGVACYCGTADTLACAAGTANGPCREVILNAPGGHKPTLADQSAGPATDAAIAVATCGTKNGVCTASCQ